jgi:hypothetical protein
MEVLRDVAIGARVVLHTQQLGIPFELPPDLQSAVRVAKQIRDMREDIQALIYLTVNDELHPTARKNPTDMVQLSQTYARLTELELAAGGKPEQGSVALPADLPEKARQFVEVQEGKDQEAQDSEDDGEYWEDQEEDVGMAELSESEALAEEYISMTGIKGKHAAALRHALR